LDGCSTKGWHLCCSIVQHSCLQVVLGPSVCGERRWCSSSEAGWIGCVGVHGPLRLPACDMTAVYMRERWSKVPACSQGEQQSAAGSETVVPSSSCRVSTTVNWTQVPCGSEAGCSSTRNSHAQPAYSSSRLAVRTAPLHSRTACSVQALGT
jgi:hypothetical protein